MLSAQLRTMWIKVISSFIGLDFNTTNGSVSFIYKTAISNTVAPYIWVFFFKI